MEKMKAKVILTAAQIKALNATPVQIIAAPGAGKGIVVEKALLTKSTGIAYDGIAAGEDLTLKYTNGSGATILTAEMTGFLDSAALLMHNQPASGSLVTANAAVVAHMSTGEVATGTCTVLVEVDYTIVTIDPLV